MWYASKSNSKIVLIKHDKNQGCGGSLASGYKWARDNHGNSAIPKWNFHKIIVGTNGKIHDTFASITKPTSKRFIDSIEKALK